MNSIHFQQLVSSTDIFLRASSNALEFSIFTLQGTGVVKTLHTFISSLLGDTLYQSWITPLYNLPTDPQRKQEQMDQIMADPCNGPLTQNLLTAWYTGNWNQLPPSWHALYDTAQQDVSQVISAESYQEGLVWPLFGSHPQGAKQQGWDAWSRPPVLPTFS